MNLEGAWEAEESRTGTGTVKGGGPALPQDPVTAPRPGTMETPAGAKPCQHTGHTHAHSWPTVTMRAIRLRFSHTQLFIQRVMAAHTQTGRPAVALH